MNKKKKKQSKLETLREVTESHLDLISEQNPSVLSCNEDTIKSLLEQAKNEGLPVKSDTNSISELKMSNGFSYGYFCYSYYFNL